MINPPESYAKHLLSLGHGYPLWTPEPSHVTHQGGLQIGDVGVIDTDTGSFDVFFNICLPSDHPIHRVAGVPDNFVPVKLNDSDVAHIHSALHPGQVLSTLSVTTTLVEASEEVGPLGRPTYEFNLPPSEGALLVLPDGAERYHLHNKPLFCELAVRNAFDWYNFAEQHLGRIVSHDALFLITGFYKAKSWALAVFHEATGSTGSVARLKASEAEDGSIMSYMWESTRALDWRVGPRINTGVPNQSIFIEGFKIAIKTGALTKWATAKLFPRPTHESSEKGNASGAKSLFWGLFPRGVSEDHIPFHRRESHANSIKYVQQDPEIFGLLESQGHRRNRNDDPLDVEVSSNTPALQSFAHKEPPSHVSAHSQEEEVRSEESPIIISEARQIKRRFMETNAVSRHGYLTVRERLYFASRRRPTRSEDMAYSLFGIFNATIPVMYGEGNRAIGRLLEYVLTDSGDATILAWTGQSGIYHSCLPIDFTVYGSLVPPHVPQPIGKEEMDKTVAALRSSVLDPAPAVKLYEQLYQLDPPSMTAQRLRLPCIAFRLVSVVYKSGPDPKTKRNVYRAELSALWSTDIQTTDNLTEMRDLYLVHPWIRPLLFQELSDGAGPALDKVTRAFRLVIRLRQSFGALLLEQLSQAEYRRVAADCLITVQLPEEVSLAQLIDSTHTIDVTS